MIALIIGLLIIVFAVFVFFSKVKFELRVCIDLIEIKINFKVKILYGLISFKKDTSIKYYSEKEEKSKENNTDYFSYIKDKKDSIREILAFITKEVKMSYFNWTTVVGLGEATSTCVIAGMVWSIKSMAIQFLHKFIEFNNSPTIEVTPNIQQFAFQTNLQCMSDMSAGKAMVIGRKMYKKWKNIRREMVSYHSNRRTAHV